MDADFIVLDADPYEIAEESVDSLADIKVLKTFRLGEQVYEAGKTKAAPKRSLPGAALAIGGRKISKLIRRG